MTSHFPPHPRGYATDLDTCPKTDVISFSRKRFCALELGFGLGLRLGLVLAEILLNTFSVKCRPSVLDPYYSY